MPGPRATPPAAARRANADAWSLIGLSLAVLWMYLPTELFSGHVLYGYDSLILHVRRLEFAREHLFGASTTLPAWYPREFLGTPFWSNLQNFPLLPTRFPLLFVDPWAAHGIGVNVAAVLSAGFTYLLCRRLGIGRLGGAVAGWTFACCGYFASRVMAGHLPLLEAYPGLPLLLWLFERYAAAVEIRALRTNLLALGLATGVVMLAGHPQIPIYAVAAAFLYLPVRASGRKALVGGAAMVAGVACMSFVLYPMARLIGRSTRVLALGPPSNDVYFPVARLKAFVLPWADVHPETYAYWDTGCYVGLLPLAAVLVLALRWAVTRHRPQGVWIFLTVLAIAALVLAFPRPWSNGGGLTILRSPARQLYLTVFALALAAGVAVDALLRLRVRHAKRRGLIAAAALILVGVHLADVRINLSPFVETVIPPPDPGVPPGLAQAVGDGRVAMDAEHVDPMNRRLDDVGVYDSILLARPYRALLALSGEAPGTNKQLVSGPELSTRALAWAGARMVVTARTDLTLPSVAKGETLSVYSVPGALPRAGFVPIGGVTYAEDEVVLRELRAGAAPNPGRMFLPARSARQGPVANGPLQAIDPAPTLTYRRPHPDRIEIDVRAAGDGYVRILEAFDPGWSATVDGHSADILPADGFVQAVRVGAGDHMLRLAYHTPGVAGGLALSAVGIAVLGGLLWGAPRFVFTTAAP